jgi:hypothetical protein
LLVKVLIGNNNDNKESENGTDHFS